MAYIAPAPITHSTVAGNVPDGAGESAIGALSVNLADGVLYTKDYFGAIVRIEGDSGNGSVASTATVNLGAIMGGVVDVTGTTTITAIALRVGQTRTVRFTDALTITHGADLVLPGAASITTAAGDFATFRGYAGGLVRCTYYSAASIAAQLHAAVSKTTPVDADELPMADSESSFTLKKLTWANLKVAVKTYLSGVSFPVGSTTPAAGAFTSLSASTRVSAPYGSEASPGVVIGDTQYGLYVSAGDIRIKSANSVVIDDQLKAVGGIVITGPTVIGTYTLTTRPAPAAGLLIYVSDGGTGANYQGSNGSTWINLG